jgi:LysM domain
MAAVMYPVESPGRGFGALPGTVTSPRRRPAAAPRRSNRSAATYWRRRIVAVGIAVGTVLTAAHAGVALGGSPLAASGRRPHVVTHVVQPGDTLWKIAGELDPKADPREVVDELVSARHTTALVPGETIVWLGN